jgi:hypothetical protein
MTDKNKSAELCQKAEAVADIFNYGFEEIIKKPEWAEYFYKITPENKEKVREEILSFITHALTVLLRMNGYVRDLGDVETFMGYFVGRVGGWDASLFKRIEEYRAIDGERGDVLSSAAQIRFAKHLSSVLLGTESKDGEVILGLSDLVTLFLMNFITPTLTEAFYNQVQREVKKWWEFWR